MWDEIPELYHPEDDQPLDERVLVVIVTRPKDWALVCTERWYRIPVTRAPRRIGAGYLAFYMGRNLGALRWSISYYAPVLGYRTVCRRDLLPDEADHPRADELYYRLDLGPLEALPHPIPSDKLRRVTFIPTTLSRLLRAREINDLWDKQVARDRLWRALQVREIVAYRDYAVTKGLQQHTLDLMVPCAKQSLAIECVPDDETPPTGEHYVKEWAPPWPGLAWAWQRFSVSEIMLDTLACVEIIRRFVAAQGGPRSVGGP